MEIQIFFQNQEVFFTEEVLAVILRRFNKSWRRSIDYTNLPIHLKPISRFIDPLVQRAIGVSALYNEAIKPQFDCIRKKLDELPIARRTDWVFNSLVDAASELVWIDDQEKTLAFFGLVAEVCGYLVETLQEDMILSATTALRFVLYRGHPGGLISTIRRLLD